MHCTVCGEWRSCRPVDRDNTPVCFPVQTQPKRLLVSGGGGVAYAVSNSGERPRAPVVGLAPNQKQAHRLKPHSYTRVSPALRVGLMLPFERDLNGEHWYSE